MTQANAKPKGNPNDKRINVRVSFAEHAAWVALAEGRGKTISELIRSAVNKDAKTRPPATPPRVVKTRLADPMLLAALARIGNNLNQLARVANQKGDLPTLVELASVERALKALRDDS